MGEGNCVEEHGGERGREVAGLNSDGVECVRNPYECCWRGDAVAELMVAGKVFWVQLVVFMKSKGASKGSRINPVSSTLVPNALAQAWFGEVKDVTVVGA